MKYYSDELRKFYDSEEECKKAEQQFIAAREDKLAKEKELKAKREERAKEVKAAWDAAQAAIDNYNNVLDQFLKDYGSYHVTVNHLPVSDLFRHFWSLF